MTNDPHGRRWGRYSSNGASGITRATVQAWHRRWLTKGATGLITIQDAPRSGKPATYTAEQVCAIVAIVRERTEDSNRAITHWIQQEIVNEAIKRDIVESISQRSVEPLLKRSGLVVASHERPVDDEKG